jgi:hypothetical protein
MFFRLRRWREGTFSRIFSTTLAMGSYSNWKEQFICPRVLYVGQNVEAKATGNNMSNLDDPEGQGSSGFFS